MSVRIIRRARERRRRKQERRQAWLVRQAVRNLYGDPCLDVEVTR
jgi:hypothetical protein